MFHRLLFPNGSIMVLMVFALASQGNAQTIAFPGAEGFGKFSTGGRGGKVIEVTNLNDSGSGSLRACLKASGARTCVFRTGGIISLKSRIIVDNPKLTIAGQTAPGDGITIRNSPSISRQTSISIDADDVIIRYIRIRPGLSGDDAINVRNGAKNIIFDHITATWSNDEVVSAASSSHNFTLQWSLIAEPLNCAKDKTNSCHGYGSLFQSSYDLSLHHNVWAHTGARAPQIDTRPEGLVDIVNNIIYNAKGQSSSWGPSHIKDKYGVPRLNYINNYLKKGVDTVHNFYVSSSGGKPYLNGNVVPAGFTVMDPDDQKYVVSNPYDIPQFARITKTSAEQAFDDVLADVGATRQLTCDGTLIFRRDSVDTRIVNDIRNGTGKIVCNTFSGTEKTSSFQGYCEEGVDFVYPSVAKGNACSDSDHDGMSDIWEVANGFNPNDDSDGKKDADGNGFTNLEEFLNGTLSNSDPGPDTDPPNSPNNLEFVSN